MLRALRPKRKPDNNNNDRATFNNDNKLSAECEWDNADNRGQQD